MKKILASCLTSVALLGSLCFSSPMAQVHASEIDTDIEQSSPAYVPIVLNVKEQVVGYTYTISQPLYSGQILQICDGDSPYDMSNLRQDISCSEAISVRDLTTGEFVVNVDSSQQPFELSFKINNLSYRIIGEATDESNPLEPFKIDLSTAESYTGVIVEPINWLKIDKTTKELPVGSSDFELKLPETIANKYDFSEYTRYFDDLSINKELIDEDEYSNYIDPDSGDWKFSLLSTINEGDKISFGATLSFLQSSISDNTLLATYNSENPVNEIDNSLVDPLETYMFSFPVEITITDDGKGDVIDEEDEINVFLNLTPEYKKLTSKGETYKIDATVEIDEDADPEAKETFEAMKQDGHFKVLFVSKDTNVATVAEDGTVTAVANGSTEILAYVEGYEDELFGISKVDVEIPEKVEEENEDSSSYPKTGDNFMAVSAAILTLGLAALVIAFVSKKQKDVNEEK